MIRGLLRLVILVAVLAAAAAYLTGYRFDGNGLRQTAERPIGTPGTISAERARDAGAKIGEKVATGASEATRAVGDAALTGKIKSKMALDDSVKAASIDVTTTNGVVTLRGDVRSEAERTRAVQLARETNGVTSVTDHLKVR